MLGVLPDIIFLVFAFPRLYYLWFRSFKLKRRIDLVLVAKLFAALLLTGTQAAQLSLFAEEHGMGIPVSLAMAGVAFITTAGAFLSS